MDEYYDDEILTESYKELVRFVRWINKQYGYHPIIIGGWAVFSYVPGLGSRDIDIIFPSRESTHRVLLPYYRAAGYKSSGVFTKEFYKEVKTSRGIERIYLDACSLVDKNILHENADVEIPWELGMKHSKEWKIQDVVARVPLLEVLLLYKVKALADRRYDLRRGAEFSPLQRAYINSKIWKDEQDIKVLMTCEIKKDFLQSLLDATNFKPYFEKEIKGFV
ncbi:MAG: hypothetical protein QMC77_00410 [Methanocellales archaeon]|nr:hypothetical protein [Methanocellales archaeon]